MSRNFFIVLVSLLSFLWTSAQSTPGSQASNPLLEPSNLDFHAPDFSKIRDYHYAPAFTHALQYQQNALKQILEDTSRPTFENTLQALERAQEPLRRVKGVFFVLSAVDTDPHLHSLQKEFMPQMAALESSMYSDPRLYRRIKKIRSKGLSEEELRLKEHYLQTMVLSGSRLHPSKKAALKETNTQLAALSAQYQIRLSRAKRKASVLISDRSQLEGLSSSLLARAQNDARNASHQGKYLLLLSETTQQHYLSELDNRELRERIYHASRERAEKNDENDTRELITQIARLRLEKAKIMGFKTYADLRLKNQMLSSSSQALKMLQQLLGPSERKAETEHKTLQEFARRTHPGITLEPWDYLYFSERLKKEEIGINQQDIKQYFDVRSVLQDGVFALAQKYYGLHFKERKDLPVYHGDVTVYEVQDRDLKPIALYYLDMYSRAGKPDGAWMSSIYEQSHLTGQKPVVVNVFNFPKPLPQRPTLLSLDETRKLFHEFGHALNGILSSVQYPTLSGTSTPKDFVEFPSQFHEFLMFEPSVLQGYARHYRTLSPMPEELRRKVLALQNFGSGYLYTEKVAAAALDLQWHRIRKPSQITSAQEFEAAALKNLGLDKSPVPLRYYSPYFAHIWGEGYSAGYYGYVWSDILSYTAWEAVQRRGGMRPEEAARFQRTVLSVGSSKDLWKQFHAFSGMEPSSEHLKRAKDLK